jgi:hypothetical protein
MLTPIQIGLTHVHWHIYDAHGTSLAPLALFILASGSFWPPKAVADCQTLSFSASFYKIRWGKNHPKSA